MFRKLFQDIYECKYNILPKCDNDQDVFFSIIKKEYNICPIIGQQILELDNILEYTKKYLENNKTLSSDDFNKYLIDIEFPQNIIDYVFGIKIITPVSNVTNSIITIKLSGYKSGNYYNKYIIKKNNYFINGISSPYKFNINKYSNSKGKFKENYYFDRSDIGRNVKLWDLENIIIKDDCMIINCYIHQIKCSTINFLGWQISVGGYVQNIKSNTPIKHVKIPLIHNTLVKLPFGTAKIKITNYIKINEEY